jgi:hypothetical protein
MTDSRKNNFRGGLGSNPGLFAITGKSASFTNMGDKSPKTKNKQAAQKQAKAAAAAKQKNANKAAGQAMKPKR